MDNQKRKIISQSYEPYKPECLGYIRSKYQLSEQEAEDVYHNTWAWVCEKGRDMPDLTDKSNKAWLYQKISWFCLNRIRGDKRYRELLSNWLLRFDKGISTDKSTKSIELGFDIAVAYEIFNLMKNSWGDKCKQLFDLYYVKGYSVKEIAEQLDQAPQTVKNNLKTCRDNIQKILNNLWNRQ